MGLDASKAICYAPAMATDQCRCDILPALKEESAKLLRENNVLKADIGYWKSCHERALEREEALKRTLQDKNAVSSQRIRVVGVVSYWGDALSAISTANGGIANVRCIRSRKYS